MTHEVDSKKTLSSPKGIRIQVDIFTSINFYILTIYVRLSRTKRSPMIKTSRFHTSQHTENREKKTQELTLKPETKCFAQQQQTYVQ